MRVDVNKARRNRQTRHIQHAPRRFLRQVAHCGKGVARDGDVLPPARPALPVIKRPAA